MRKSRFTDQQVVGIIREADRDVVADVAKRHGVSEQTIYAWRKRFGALRTEDVRRLRQLETENARLKKLVAERDLEIEVMKEVAAKNGERAGPSPASGVWPGARALGAAGLHAVFGGTIGIDVSGQQSDRGRQGDRTDARTIGAIPALRLSADQDLPGPGRRCDEPWPGLATVAAGQASGATPAGPQAGCVIAATADAAERGEPGVEL
jgi:putative transposase